MARIEIGNLYPIHNQQLLNEITEREIQTVEEHQANTVTAGNSNVNQPSLANMFDQNVDNFLVNLRTQMGVVIFGATDQFDQGLNSF
ncbi:MAG TPA: hypothetical protein VE956_12850 [Nodularia sp. (in: cyanobacteria)]|nr:hypothetical protein [Nodularia sp. (in: cyanobacteria)]